MKKIIKEQPEDELEVKDKKRKGAKTESVEKRRKAKKKDKMARWSGMILFLSLLIAGFLMWVAGEVKVDPVVKSPSQSRVVPSDMPSNPGTNRVVVE